MTMSEHIVGFQVSAPQQNQQKAQQVQRQQKRPPTKPSSIGEFIVDDLKLFVSPVRALVDEFIRQVKRTG
jgi:hypothetical protein